MLLQWANGLAPVDVNITRIIVHPQYKSPRKYYDIAIMELEYDVLFTDNVQPACLWSEFNTDPLGPDATVTGWGVVETGEFVKIITLLHLYYILITMTCFSKHKILKDDFKFKSNKHPRTIIYTWYILREHLMQTEVDFLS